MHQGPVSTRARSSTRGGFWKSLPRPFFCLAPMANVTDVAFRNIVASASRHGKPSGGPDVFWTEFVSADGLVSSGKEKLLIDLKYSDKERPIVAQLFGSNPENMEKASALCAELGFDGIDINMGCPDKTIEKQNAGAAMIKTPENAIRIIESVRRGAPNLPISVKTRIGYNTDEINTWIPLLLEQNLSALTVHARTRKELSNVPARWETIRRVVDIRNTMHKETLIIGNGDVMGIEDGKEKARESGCDGIMIGRAALGNPWIFDASKSVLETGTWNLPWWGRWIPRALQKKILGEKRFTVSQVSEHERLQTLIEHLKLFDQLFGKEKNPATMKKHAHAYIRGFPGAKELRSLCMETRTINETIACITTWMNKTT